MPHRPLREGSAPASHQDSWVDFLRSGHSKAFVSILLLVSGIACVLEYGLLRDQVLAESVAEIRSAQELMRSDALAFAATGTEAAEFLVQTPPIQGVVRAEKGGGYDAQEASSGELWKTRLQQIFRGYLSTNPAAYQLRYIGWANDGRELVRVERRKNGIFVVPEEELQSKKARVYLKAASRIPEDTVYVSRLNLNREQGRIELPYRPTLRFVAPVQDGEGKFFGAVVVNLDARSLMDDIAARWPGDIYLTDGEGNYLFHPDQSLWFSLEKGKSLTFFDEFLTTGDTSVERQFRGVGVYAPKGAPAAPILFRSEEILRLHEGKMGVESKIGIPMKAVARKVLAGTWPRLLGWLGVGFTIWLLLFFYWSKVQRSLQSQKDAIRVGAIVNSSQDVIASLDRSGRIESWNRAAAKLTGYAPAEVLGKKLTSLFFEQSDEEGIRTGTFDQRWLLKSGESLEFSVTCSPLMGTQGDKLGYAIVARDVSKERAREEQFREMNVRLEETVRRRTEELVKTSSVQEAILASAGHAIIATGAQGKIQVFNPAAEQMLGYSLREVQGRVSIESLVSRESCSPEKPSPLQEGELHAILGGQSSASTEAALLSKSGKAVPVAMSLSLLKGVAGSERLLLVASNETERIERESQLLEARRAAESASRAKTQFLANMSHEIRTPMNAVQGMLQLLERSELSVKQRQYAERARTASDVLLDILNDILDFSKIEAGKLSISGSVFRLDRLLGKISTMLSSSLQDKDLELIFVLDQEVPRQVKGDPLRLQQVLLNLSSNAIKFTPAGEVILEVKLEGMEGGRARLSFHVDDTGIGMTPEHLSRVFDGFEQAEGETTRRYGGTGLGLTISRRLVELMGGELEARSRVGQGSSFRFSLTLDVVEPVVDAEPRQAPTPMLGGAARVLIVEKNRKALQVASSLVESLGWKAVSRRRAGEALGLLREGRNFEMILLDRECLLPLTQSESEEFVRRLEGSLVLLTERYTDPELPNPFPAASVILKPLTASKLFDAAAVALSGGTAAESCRPGTEKHLKGLRILVVEDVEVNQQVARALLEQEGAHVIVAGGGRDALRILSRKPKMFDAVLMDVQMPDVDGLEVTRRVHAEISDFESPVIAMTANAMTEDRATCLAAGMVDHVGKPFRIDNLVEVILRSVERHRAAE